MCGARVAMDRVSEKLKLQTDRYFARKHAQVLVDSCSYNKTKEASMLTRKSKMQSTIDMF